MTLARYMVRRQDNGRYCIWDHMTKRPAEDRDRRYIDLDFEDALNLVRPLNNPQQVRDERGA
jgi:hypothetical protein